MFEPEPKKDYEIDEELTPEEEAELLATAAEYGYLKEDGSLDWEKIAADGIPMTLEELFAEMLGDDVDALVETKLKKGEELDAEEAKLLAMAVEHDYLKPDELGAKYLEKIASVETGH